MSRLNKIIFFLVFCIVVFTLFKVTSKKPVKYKNVRQVEVGYIKQHINILSKWIFKNSFRCSRSQSKKYATILSNYKYPLILASIIRNESSFDVTAYSKSGAIGLMQIIPNKGHIKQLRENGIIRNARDLFDPEVNVKAGNFILLDILKINKGDIREALRMYSGSRSYSKNISETLGKLILYITSNK